MIGNFLQWRGRFTPTSKALPFLLLLLFLSVGCQGPWEAYEEIELGKPFPKNSICARKGFQGKHSAEFMEYNHLLFPAFAGYSWVKAYQVEGKVVQKGYQAWAYGDWIFFQTGGIRTVMECLLPNNVQDPPKDWTFSDSTSKKVGKWSEFRYTIDCLIDSPSDECIVNETCHYVQPDNSSKPSHSTLVYLSPIYEKITATHIMGFLMFQIGTTGEMLRGLSRDGYELSFHDSIGDVVKIKNLGNRRIRMEMSYSRISESYLLYCCFKSPEDSVDDISEKAFENVSGVWKVRHAKGMPMKTYRRSFSLKEELAKSESGSDTTTKNNLNDNPPSK